MFQANLVVPMTHFTRLMVFNNNNNALPELGSSKTHTQPFSGHLLVEGTQINTMQIIPVSTGGH